VAYEYSKFAEFYADFKSVVIIEKKSTQKNLFAKHFCKFTEEENLRGMDRIEGKRSLTDGSFLKDVSYSTFIGPSAGFPLNSVWGAN
jgi:hypothetical protein